MAPQAGRVLPALPADNRCKPAGYRRPSAWLPVRFCSAPLGQPRPRAGGAPGAVGGSASLVPSPLPASSSAPPTSRSLDSPLRSSFSCFRALLSRRSLFLDIARRFPYALRPVYFKRHHLQSVADRTKTYDARISSDPFFHCTPGTCVLASCGSFRLPIAITSTSAGWYSAGSAWLRFGSALFPSASSSDDAQLEFESLHSKSSIPRKTFLRRPITVHSISLLSPGPLCPLPPFHPYRLAFHVWLSAFPPTGKKGGGLRLRNFGLHLRN